METERAFAIDNSNYKLSELIHQQMIKLLQIFFHKWDESTQHILQHLDYFPREQVDNFELTAQVKGVSFGLWGNLTKNPRCKDVEFAQVNMSFTIPNQLSLAHVSVRMLNVTDQNISVLYQPVNEIPHQAIVGGVLYFNLLDLPDLPKNIGEWTIRTISSADGCVKQLVYPFKNSAIDSVDEAKEPTNDSSWQISVSYQIPPHCYIHPSSVQVAQWNLSMSKWDNSGISDNEIDNDTGKVTFKTTKFGTFALVQVFYII